MGFILCGMDGKRREKKNSNNKMTRIRFFLNLSFFLTQGKGEKNWKPRYLTKAMRKNNDINKLWFPIIYSL